MLLSIRRGATTLAFKILIAFFIVALVLLFSLGDYIGAFSNNAAGERDPVVFKAAGTSVTESELAGQIVNYGNTFGQIYQTKFDTAEKIKERGIQELAQNALLSRQISAQEQKELNLRTGSTQVARLIATDERFRDSDGNFSETLYNGQLGLQGHNNATYRESLAAQSNASTLASALTFAPEFLPDALTAPLVKYRFQERKFETVTLNRDLVDEPTPTEEDLRAYLTENQDNFRVPELRTISAIIIDAKDLEDRVEISEEKILERFEKNEKAGRYTTDERRNVQQIVFDTEEQVTEALAALEDGATLADLGTATSRAVSDLGDLPKRQMDATLAETAFVMEANKISEPVQTDFGWHVLNVSEITPATSQTLDDVRTQISDTLKAETTSFMAEELSIQLDERIGEGNTLEDTANDLGLEVQTFAPVSSIGTSADRKLVTDMPRDEKFLSEAFRTAKGENSFLGSLENNRYFVLRVDAIDEPRDQTFEEAQASLANIVKRQQWSDALLVKAESLIAETSEGKTLSAIATDLGVEVEVSDFISRTSASAAATDVRYLSGESFDIPKADGISAVQAGNNYILARLLEVRDVNVDENDASKSAVTSFVSQIQNELNQQYQSKLRDKTKISTNPDALDRAIEQAARAIARQ